MSSERMAHSGYSATQHAIRFPKTYPTLATPIFTVQRPVRGIAHDVETALSKVIHSEAQKLRGSEMVFQVRSMLLLCAALRPTLSAIDHHDGSRMDSRPRTASK